MNEKSGKSLTSKQERVILAVLESRTIEDACKKVGVTKSLYYKWLKTPNFEAALKQKREELIGENLDRLGKSMGRAIDVLIDLLNSESESIRRYVANDVITHFLKIRELRDLEERLTSIERLVLERKTYR